MDAESLKSLVWLLIWGGLFFVMMRYGCGAHMMGGHGSHGKHGDTKPGGNAKDLVCGMTVDSQQAAAAAVWQRRTYYFCSTSCRNQFEQAPEKYVSTADHNGPRQGGHHHA